jgi:hypothetical protein
MSSTVPAEPPEPAEEVLDHLVVGQVGDRTEQRPDRDGPRA